MVHDSVRNLKFDRRFLRRRGWISQAELEEELARLPDAEPRAEWVGGPRLPQEGEERRDSERGPEDS